MQGHKKLASFHSAPHCTLTSSGGFNNAMLNTITHKQTKTLKKNLVKVQQ
jgi:hypothetical protein